MEIWNYVLISCTIFLASVGAVTILLNIIPSCIEAYDEYKRRKEYKNRRPDYAEIKDWEDTRLRHYDE